MHVWAGPDKQEEHNVTEIQVTTDIAGDPAVCAWSKLFFVEVCEPKIFSPAKLLLLFLLLLL